MEGREWELITHFSTTCRAKGSYGWLLDAFLGERRLRIYPLHRLKFEVPDYWSVDFMLPIALIIIPLIIVVVPLIIIKSVVIDLFPLVF